MSATSNFRVTIEEIPDIAMAKPMKVFTGVVEIVEDGNKIIATANSEIKGTILERVLCAVAGLEYSPNA